MKKAYRARHRIDFWKTGSTMWLENVFMCVLKRLNRTELKGVSMNCARILSIKLMLLQCDYENDISHCILTDQRKQIER